MRVAASFTSSSSWAGSSSLTDLFQLAKTFRRPAARRAAEGIEWLGAMAFRVGDIISHEYVGSREDTYEHLLQLVDASEEAIELWPSVSANGVPKRCQQSRNTRHRLIMAGGGARNPSAQIAQATVRDSYHCPPTRVAERVRLGDGEFEPALGFPALERRGIPGDARPMYTPTTRTRCPRPRGKRRPCARGAHLQKRLPRRRCRVREVGPRSRRWDEEADPGTATQRAHASGTRLWWFPETRIFKSSSRRRERL